MTKLSDTQRVILSKAAQHEALLAEPPAKLPAAARQSVLRSLVAKGVLEEVPAPRGHIGLGWRQDEDGAWMALRITAAGLAAIGVAAARRSAVAALNPCVRDLGDLRIRIAIHMSGGHAVSGNGTDRPKAAYLPPDGLAAPTCSE